MILYHKMNRLIIFAGLTCAGKDTCQRYLIEKYGATSVVSTTTRPMRPKETEGVEYHFTNNKKFLSLIKKNQLLEYRSYNTLVNNEPAVWYYGITKDEIDPNSNKTYLAIVDPIGYYALKEAYPAAELIWVDSSLSSRKRRCKMRGDFDPYEFARRNKEDGKTFGELRKIADHIIKNNTTEKRLHKQLDKLFAN